MRGRCELKIQLSFVVVTLGGQAAVVEFGIADLARYARLAWQPTGREGKGWDGKLRSRHQKFATHFKHPSLRPTAVLGERTESKTLTKIKHGPGQYLTEFLYTP